MDYPARLEVDAPERIANWRPLVHWILAIPHFVIAYFLGIAGQVVAVASWFVILFTGRMPQGLADFQCMVQRYTTRVSVYVGFLHEQYPPFEFATTPGDPGGTPVRVDFEPSLGGRNRLTVGLRLIWLIPAAIVTMIIGIIGFACVIIGFFVVLFTGRWPEGLRTWVMKALRASLRLNAYATLLTDRYPPLSFE